jgi:serine/threonine protein kinase
VLPVFKAGEEDGELYLAMRFVDGDDLRTLVDRDGPLAPERAAQIAVQVGAALDAAHARRLVHRDVKPANVLLGGGDHAYLTDFGVVKALDETSGQTRTGDVVGTLDYVAPERIKGEADGPPSDLYALGCLLFYTLTGRVPFPLDTSERKLWAHLSEPPPAVPEHPAFDAVIARALAKDPAQRFESGAALGAAAVAAAGGPKPGEVLENADRATAGRGPRRAGRGQGQARRRAGAPPRHPATDAVGARGLRRRDGTDPARARDGPRGIADAGR